MTPKLAQWRRRTDAPITALAVGTLPLLALELMRSDLTDTDQLFLDGAGLAVLAVLAVDYLVELALAADRAAYVREQWLGLAVVVAQAIALVPALAGVGALRVVRGGRAVRLFTSVARALGSGAAAANGRNVIRDRAATFVLELAGLTWVTSAVAFTLAEDVGKGGRIHSFFDALWWSATTITTVGYGEVYPITAAGRIVAVFTMLIGITTFAVVTARLAEFLLRSPSNDRA